MIEPLPEEIDEVLWREACRRADAIRRVLGSDVAQTSAVDIAYLADELGLSLGAVIPDLDVLLAKRTTFPFSPKHPILPLDIRPALLAGVAIVERAGPAMLKMLQGHMMGENKTRFIMATDHLISPAFEWGPPQQMQLI